MESVSAEEHTPRTVSLVMQTMTQFSGFHKKAGMKTTQGENTDQQSAGKVVL